MNAVLHENVGYKRGGKTQQQGGVGAGAGNERAKQGGVAKQRRLREVLPMRIAQRTGDEVIQKLQSNTR